MNTERRLTFGCNRALPVDVHTAWGARLIYHSRLESVDLLSDRQSRLFQSEKIWQELHAWLQTHIPLILKACGACGLDAGDNRIVEIYRDGEGIVMGSPQASWGYLYIVAWLHKHHEGWEKHTP